MGNETQTQPKPFEPIPIYHEGVFDRKYWYTLQAKRYLKQKWEVAELHINALFEQHTFYV